MNDEQLAVLQTALEEILADPSSRLRDIDAVLLLARRFGLADVERLAEDHLVTHYVLPKSLWK